MKQSIELHIDELVLHGFSPHDRYRIGSAVENELIRLFTEQGIPSSLSAGGEIPLLHTDSFTMNPASKGNTIGTQIANTVYSSFPDTVNKAKQ